MLAYIKLIDRMRRTEEGASLVEYALLIALIALVCFAAIVFFGGQVNDSLSKSASQLG